MTTREPGASEVLTWGWTSRPRSTAALASRPAAIITDGLEVLVQEVMAAITTDPSSTLLPGLTAVATPPPARLASLRLSSRVPPSLSIRAGPLPGSGEEARRRRR